MHCRLHFSGHYYFRKSVYRLLKFAIHNARSYKLFSHSKAQALKLKTDQRDSSEQDTGQAITMVVSMAEIWLHDWTKEALEKEKSIFNASSPIYFMCNEA